MSWVVARALTSITCIKGEGGLIEMEFCMDCEVFFKELEERFGCLSERDKRLVVGGFEEAKKLMLAKIKEQQDVVCRKNVCEKCLGFNACLEWLEGELKGDSASVEADAVKEVGLK